MRNSFNSCHPLVAFTYFGAVICFSAFSMNPLLIGVSFVFSLVFKALWRDEGDSSTAYLAVLFVIAAIINPAFSHKGLTILTYLPSGNPLTLESIIYGVAAGLVMVNVILWLKDASKIFTTDKFIYLFGRIIPSLSLVLSMVLRFVPRFKEELNRMIQAQKALGNDPFKGSMKERVSLAIKLFSAMVSLSLEDAVETSDSMKARGYGLPGRTAYSIYNFSKKDRFVLVWIAIFTLLLIVQLRMGLLYFSYYPAISCINLGMVPGALCFALLCSAPLLSKGREAEK